MSAVPALALENITVTFVAHGGGGIYTAVRDTTLIVGEGEFVSVVGPTGCGKSTLLNIAAGLLESSAGSVRVQGEPLVGINRHAGYMFQSDALLPWLSALGNVELGLKYRGVDPGDAREQAMAWLARVGLSGHGVRYPHHLSGGMKKRVALAQMLILDPKI
ncbi:MAG: ATP-binding cassette domain-containing protein, partial [Betaproteobacteria bacterium]|nr:ATP-binding cassette domain-containing protein [Betaproteobacteria bacterium]